jgi:hypothetical protein
MERQCAKRGHGRRRKAGRLSDESRRGCRTRPTVQGGAGRQETAGSQDKAGIVEGRKGKSGSHGLQGKHTGRYSSQWDKTGRHGKESQGRRAGKGGLWLVVRVRQAYSQAGKASHVYAGMQDNTGRETHEAKLAGIGGMTCRQGSMASRRGTAGQKASRTKQALSPLQEGRHRGHGRQTHRQRRQATHSRLAVQGRQDKLGT